MTTKVTVINELDISIPVSVKVKITGDIIVDGVKYYFTETSEEVNLATVETVIDMKRTYENCIACILYLYLDDCAYKYVLHYNAFSPYVITIKPGNHNPIASINGRVCISREKIELNSFWYFLCCGSYDCALDF